MLGHRSPYTTGRRAVGVAPSPLGTFLATPPVGPAQADDHPSVRGRGPVKTRPRQWEERPPTRSPDSVGGGETTGPRWLTDTPTLEGQLPGDVQQLLGRLLGEEPVETLDEWIGAVRRHTDGGPIGTEQLCHAGTPTPHWGELDGTRYHFSCFYDAVVLSALVDEPVDIRTESPDGAIVTATAVGTDGLEVSPETAVFSFGVDEAVTPPDADGPSAADVYTAVCPYVRAFPHPDAYLQWVDDVPAATVAMPLPGATDVAAALVEPASEEATDR